MKVVSQDGALAILGYIPDEVRPLKGFHLPALLHAVGERYRAAKSPTLEESRSTGAKYQNGLFSAGDREITIGEISLHNDAISIATTDTADSEIVLNDFFEWLKDEFKFREPSTPPIRIYQSDLVIQFDNNPENAFGAIAPFLSFIQEEMTPPNAHSKKHVQFAVIGFGTDPSVVGPSPEFTLARRVNVPWRIGLYFSKAHMKTSSHIRALELLDGLLTQKR
jgi:hypothetical protein